MFRRKAVGVFFVFITMALSFTAQLYAKTDTVLSDKIKAELMSKAWSIYLIYQNKIRDDIKSVVKEDVLTFTADAVVSKNLLAEGYLKGGSAYRVKVAPDGAYVWESIQLHENQIDTVLMKGELKDGVMKGVIVYQPQGKPGRTVNFTTVRP